MNARLGVNAVAGGRVGVGLFAALAACVAAPALAEQDVVALVKRVVTISPHLSVSETLTNNVALSATAPRSEQITEISPGVKVGIDGARLKAHIDYAANEVIYAQGTSPRRHLNALNAFGNLELIEDWAFVDFTGSISQQATSALGAQSLGSTSLSGHQNEVSTYSVKPYVRGRIGSLANYEARLSRAVTSSKGASSGVAAGNAAFQLTGASAWRRLGWSAAASRQTIDYSAGRSTEADRVSLGLSYELTPQLRVSLSGGQASDNYTTVDKQTTTTSGMGLAWSPSETTKVLASRDRESFGDSHQLSIEHRSPRTAWKLSDSKHVASALNQTVASSGGSIYDLLFSQFASIQPDPVARAQLVLAYLQSYGISPTASVVNSSLTSAVTLQRRQELMFALLGIRDTITFIATRSESERLDSLSAAVDDFTGAGQIRQQGFSVNYAHRLTPDYSLGLLLSQQSSSSSVVNNDTTLRMVSLNVTGRLAKKATASVGLRRSVSHGTSTPYTETSVRGNLNVQF